jgi:hypothetical protein
MAVQLALSIRRLWAVDPTEQSFCVELTCFTYHESHAHDGITTPRSIDKALQLVNGDRAWTSKRFKPELCVANALNQEWGAWQFMLSPEQGPHGRRLLLGKRDLVATIRQEFPLSAFPFDVQALDIKINLEADPTVAYLLPMRPNLSNGSPSVADVAYDDIRFPDLHFIADLPHAQGIRTLRTLPPKSGPQRLGGAIASSQAFVSIPIKRASAKYLCTSGAVLFIISLCVCSTFIVPASNSGTRMALDLVLLLTAVAFKLYQAQALPQTAYVTRLDGLAVAVFVLLFVVLCVHSAVFIAQRFDVEAASWVNLGGWAGCLLGWMSFTIGWLCSCYSSMREQHKRMCTRLRVLAAQHGHEVDVLVGMDRPGGKRLDRSPRVPTPGTATRQRPSAVPRKSMV